MVVQRQLMTSRSERRSHRDSSVCGARDRHVEAVGRHNGPWLQGVSPTPSLPGFHLSDFVRPTMRVRSTREGGRHCACRNWDCAQHRERGTETAQARSTCVEWAHANR